MAFTLQVSLVIVCAVQFNTAQFARFSCPIEGLFLSLVGHFLQLFDVVLFMSLSETALLLDILPEEEYGSVDVN